MAKIPFSVEHRDKIESGEYKVFAHEHEEQEARIVCWDNKGEYPIVALVDNEPEKFDRHGRVPGGNRGGEFSLFIVTPEEELTGFEEGLNAFLFDFAHSTVEEDPTECIKKNSGVLLYLAKSHLLQSGELMTQEQHEKLMETQYKETLDGVKKNWHDYFTPQAVTDIYNAGRNDVLKDLPRWKKAAQAFGNYTVAPTEAGEYCLLIDGYFIMLSDLEKLPKDE